MSATRLTKAINWVALTIATAIALVLPTGYWLVSYESVQDSMSIEAEVHATLVNQVINRNPELWRYEEHRLTGMLETDLTETDLPEKRRISDKYGNTLAQAGGAIPAPVVTRSAELLDSGRSVGRIEISRSLLPLLQKTGVVALLGLALSLVVFVTFRIVPLRALERVLGELRQEKEKAEVTLASIGDAVVTVDKSGRIQYLNPVAEAMTGWSRAEAFGQPLLAVLDVRSETPGIPGSPLAPLEAGNETGIRDTALLSRRHQETVIIAFTTSPIKDGAGAATGNIVVFRDITESRRARQALQTSEERLRVLVETAIDGIVTFDAETRKVESFNPAAKNIFGYSAAEAADIEIGKLIPILDNPSEINQMETSGRSKGGQEVPLELSASETSLEGKRTYVVTVRDLTTRKEIEAAAAYFANYDRLTGLPNRSLFRDRLTQAMQRAQRSKRLVGLLILDIDQFKTINDSLGHAAGDKLLQQVTQRLEQILRRTDTISRHGAKGLESHDKYGATLSRQGGDEFTIILEGIVHAESVAVIAQKILDSFAASFTLSGQEIFVSTCIGIAIYPNDNKNPDGLIMNADSAMYRAKEQGRASYAFYTEDMNARSSQRLALEADLRRALARREFLLHYQPKIDLASGQVTGMEALLRWQSPERGLVSPLDFIPLLEETGQIIPVGEWVLRAACEQIRAWQNAGLPPLRVAVNISARQFKQKELTTVISYILQETGVAPQHLELELTESMLMERLDANIEMMQKLNEMGIHISIDDFGTGYSSLSYLKRFPIQTLKIDRSFVRDITTDPDDAAIANAVIALAHSLRLKVVAEGVETEEQLAFLRGRNCDQIQGYFYSRPLPADAFAKWVVERNNAILA